MTRPLGTVSILVPIKSFNDTTTLIIVLFLICSANAIINDAEQIALNVTNIVNNVRQQTLKKGLNHCTNWLCFFLDIIYIVFENALSTLCLQHL